MTSKESALLDPLREPRDARARLRQKRQAEAAAKYNATFENRVCGGLLSCRPTVHPVASYSVQANLDATMADAPSAATSRGAPPSRPLIATPHMEGRGVNIYGQTLDHDVPAIQQLINGAFYTVRGNGVPELNSRREGKFMRFRAGRVPDAPARDASTMTRPSTSSAAYGAGISKPKPRSCDVSVDATNNAPPLGGSLDFLLHAAQSKIDEKKMQKQLAQGKSKTSSTPAYMKRTLSSQKKVEENPPASARRAAPEATAASGQQEGRVAATRPATARAKSMFETALEKQKQHGPGEAAIIDEQELHRIMEIAGRANFNAQDKRPQSARPKGQFTGFS
jgi:hypothetical protein